MSKFQFLYESQYFLIFRFLPLSDKSVMLERDGGFQLPKLGKNSPFKGFLDISIVN